VSPLTGRGYTLTVEETGSAHVEAMLERLASNAEETRRFFQKVADLLMEQSRRRWNTEPGWRPLEWSTIKRKARSKDPRVRANAHQTLRATGALERALTVWGAPGQKYEVRDDEMAFGIYVGGEKKGGIRAADVWYGVIAQKGVGEPKREILKATRATRRRVEEALRDHLLEGL
jgi:hypothetical protein